MSYQAHLFTLEEVQETAASISRPRPLGRVLLGFLERKVKDSCVRLIGLLFSFDPERASEVTFEGIDESVTKAIASLRKLAAVSREPFYSEAAAKLKEARDWIASGYSPSRPPSEADLQAVKDEQASRLLEVLSG